MRKKIFAILMGVMMIATFMPAMAFADGEQAINLTWTEKGDYSSATVSYVDSSFDRQTVVVDTKRTMDGHGVITAVADLSQLSNDIQSALQEKKTAYYYDLTDVKVSVARSTNIAADSYLGLLAENSGIIDWQKPSFEYGLGSSDFTGVFGETTVTFAVPSYIENLSDFPKLVQPVDYTTLANDGMISVAVAPAKYAPYAEGSYEMTYTFEKGKEEVYADVYGAAEAKVPFTVTAADSILSRVYVKMDGMEDTAYRAVRFDNTESPLYLTTFYTGENQTFDFKLNGLKDLQGLKFQYSEDGGKTWSDEAPAIKNVYKDITNNESVYEFKLRAVPGGNEKKAKVKDVAVRVMPVQVGAMFKQKAFIFSAADEIKTSDLVQCKSIAQDLITYDPGQQLSKGVSKVSSDDEVNVKDMPKADEEQINAFLDKYVKIDGITNDFVENQVLTFNSESWNVNEMCKDAYNDADFASFLANYGLFSQGGAIRANRGPQIIESNNDASSSSSDYAYKIVSKSTSLLSVVKGENKITAKSKTVTYHIKKAKKLSKNKSFKLKDTAKYGEIKYSKKSGSKFVKVASNGKVTVKKGLKKGTYTVKVTEKVAGTDAYSAAKATKTLKIKIAK